MSKDAKKSGPKPADSEQTAPIQATATEATADTAVPSVEAAAPSKPAQAQSKKKKFALGSKTEVNNLTGHLAEVLPDGSHVTVLLPVLEYNDFVQDAQKLIDDREYEAVRGNNSGEALNTTVVGHGITVHVRGVFA